MDERANEPQPKNCTRPGKHLVIVLTSFMALIRLHPTSDHHYHTWPVENPAIHDSDTTANGLRACSRNSSYWTSSPLRGLINYATSLAMGDSSITTPRIKDTARQNSIRKNG